VVNLKPYNGQNVISVFPPFPIHLALQVQQKPDNVSSIVSVAIRGHLQTDFGMLNVIMTLGGSILHKERASKSALNTQ